MMKYETPAELRVLEKMLTDFTYSNGWDIDTVFDDWLYFIINNFNVNPKIDTAWRYTKEQNIVFHNMMYEWILVMKKKLFRYGWYDIFGVLYEACIAGKGSRSNSGQFFTPNNICDLMVNFSSGDQIIIGKKVSDPTCGSGRLLLAFNSICPGNYMCAEDLDKTCCMMTVANYIVHGIRGEVVWHNSLLPDSWYGGWKVNDNLNNSLAPLNGIPHMQEINREDSLIMKIWENRKSDNIEAGAQTIQSVPFNYTQLSLWD